MSIDIKGLLTSGKKLTDEQVEYAVDRGITLPDEYDAQVRQYETSRGEDGARPPFPLIDHGSYPPNPGNELGVLLTEADLTSMTKPMLEQIASAKGIEVSGTKPEMVATLMSGGPITAPNDEGEGPDEGDEDN